MKTERICPEEHHFYKSSDCPVCPLCEKLNKSNVSGFLQKLSSPAWQALENQGIKSLMQLSTYSEKEVLKFHGIGKTAIPILKTCLAESGLSFRIDD